MPFYSNTVFKEVFRYIPHWPKWLEKLCRRGNLKLILAWIALTTRQINTIVSTDLPHSIGGSIWHSPSIIIAGRLVSVRWVWMHLLSITHEIICNPTINRWGSTSGYDFSAVSPTTTGETNKISNIYSHGQSNFWGSFRFRKYSGFFTEVYFLQILSNILQ